MKCMAIKVSIYKENATQLERLSRLIRESGNCELCTASTNVLSIIDDCRAVRPDVILMDMDMPAMSGIEAIRLVKTVYSEVNVMILTIFDDKNKIFDAMYAGATGFLLKTTSPAQIIKAIEELYQGGSPMSSIIARKILELLIKPINGTKHNDYKLTKREREVLQRLLKGDSYKMVAEACSISIGTVYSHINNIYKKLHINSKSEAVIKTILEHLV